MLENGHLRMLNSISQKNKASVDSDRWVHIDFCVDRSIKYEYISLSAKNTKIRITFIAK